MDFRDGSICWTTTPYSNDALKELPAIEMYGWQQSWSDVITGIQTWMTRAKKIGKSSNPYEKLYIGTAANNYILPFFNEYHHNISQTWQENQGPVGAYAKQLTDFAETVGKAMLPAAGILTPKSYSGSVPASYSFTFNLINTNASTNSIATNVANNQKFLHQFIHDNLHGQNGALSITPPLIYEILIPGVRWCPAAIVSGITVNNKGTLNKNTNGIIRGAITEYIYPDAWEVTVSITELINESKTIWADAFKGGTARDGIITRAFA